MNDNTVCCQNASVTEPQRDRRPLRSLCGRDVVGAVPYGVYADLRVIGDAVPYGVYADLRVVGNADPLRRWRKRVIGGGEPYGDGAETWGWQRVECG